MREIEKVDNFVLSYLYLRQLIGILGICLPFLLVFGSFVIGNCDCIQISLSHYYYTTMHIVFVGTLCVMGGSLITYKGNSRLENRVSNVAGGFSFCIAMFPTAIKGFKTNTTNCPFITLPNNMPPIINTIHFIAAALLFICFIIFCFKIFQHADLNRAVDFKKNRRNNAYKVCGWIILISILAIAAVTIYDIVFKTNVFPYSTIIFETTALLAFGFSWLLKGSLEWPHSSNKVKRLTIQYFR